MSVSNQTDAHRAWISAYPFESVNNLLGVRLSATNSSTSAALVGDGNVLVFTNTGSVEAYVTYGTSTVVATTSHFPVLPGTQIDVSLPEVRISGGYYVAAITATGSTTILVHRGYGN